MDKNVFPHWTKHETIPIGYQSVPTVVESASIQNLEHTAIVVKEEQDEDTFTLVENGMVEVRCKVVETKDEEEDEDSAWIQVDTIST
jgi:hypothetical protein